MKFLIMFLTYIFFCFSLFAAVPNKIYIQLSEIDKNFQEVSQGKNYTFTDAKIKINNSEWMQIKELSTRGQNCLKAYRRCLSVELDDKIVLNNQNSISFTGKKFNLASLWQDQGYISSHLGYYLASELDLFPLQHQYVELFIDDVSYGVYLILDKPQGYMKNVKQSPYIGRLWYVSMIDKEVYSPEYTTVPLKKFRTAFKDLVRLRINSKGFHTIYKGERLYNYLNSKMNFDKYLTYLAFNTVLQNGDYSDELYYYAKKTDDAKDIYFDILAWDMDDLFKKPHGGLWNSILFKHLIKHKLLYSTENVIDQTIGMDKFLYNKFKFKIYELLTKYLTEDKILTTLDKVKSDIYPYISENEILDASIHDKLLTPFGVEKYSTDYILNLIEKRKSDLINRRAEILKIVTPISE